MEDALDTLIAYLPALACAGAMAVCFWMMRGHGKEQPSDTDAELKQLREEVERLKEADTVSAADAR